MAGAAVLSAFMQTLFEKLAAAALDEVQSLRGVHREAQKLSATLSTIQGLLEDAEEKQLRDRLVRAWLMKLKAVAYDMDDLLEEYTAKEQRTKFADRAKSPWKKVCNYISCYCWHQGMFHHKIARKIKDIQERLDEIARERDNLGLRALGESSRLEITERPQTSSLVDDLNVFGREEDKEYIVQMMLKFNPLSRLNVSVLPIVGMGGLGKTTLTQLVYNDDRVKEHFQLRMWVCVSENFDEIKLTKETIESTASGFSSVTTNMNLLQDNLCEKLKGKRFLLVLDDVWNEDQDKWHRFRNTLIVGEKGSKIVVTTRNENVGRIMGGLPPYQLKQLSHNDCWTLFKNYAFVDGDSSKHPRLEEIGKEIVKKLKGLPLAAKAIGSLLYSKLDEDEWKDILKSEIWELPPDKNNIMPALRLSYKHLPPHLKQCFAFCSVFHKDYVFEKDKLVQIWMALGFIQPQGRKRMENIGNNYFDDLVSRSFFQPHKGKYVMHDAIHDLAQSISIGECLRTEDIVECNGPKRIRHLSFSCDNSMCTSFEPFCEFDKLRTLLLLRGYKSHTANVPDNLFLKLKFLRVLDLHRRDIKELPHSIGNLEQLRYLGLSSTGIKTLPPSIIRLHNLQTLKLKGCNELDELPTGLTNLINLRHLEASAELISRVASLGRLSHLQELDEFIVRNNRGYRITELKNMTELRGHLCVRNIENVVSGKEASEAKLDAKEYLNALDLVWTDEKEVQMVAESINEEVLEGLRPHTELKELAINGYAGFHLPSWLGSLSLSNLQTIHLSNCKNCKFLPPLGQLPYLRYLDIVGVYGITRIGEEFSGNGVIRGFPSLHELILEDMPGLEVWNDSEEDQLFPCLTDLEIVECPNLRALPRLPPTMTRLKISEAGLDFLPELRSLDSLSSSLLSLNIYDCPNLTSLQQGLLNQQLSALEELTITNCKDLEMLPHESFQNLVSLKSLHIYNCPMLTPHTPEEALLPSSIEDLQVSCCSSDLINCLLKGLSNLTALAHLKIAECHDLYYFPKEQPPVTLKFLGILDCSNLQVLPTWLRDLSSLTTLVITNCPLILPLPRSGLPTRLQELYIKGCPSLKKHFVEDGRRDWHMIAHISDVVIDGERIVSERREGDP